MDHATRKNVIFVDYQNFYHGLHQHHGVKPFRVNMLNLLKERVYEAGIKDAEVRVYTGIPDAETDPQGFTTMTRFCDWLRHNGAKVWTNTLRYHQGEDGKLHATEKGADVRLACELVALAMAGRLEHAVIVSADQDLNQSVKVAKESIRELGLAPVCFHSVKLSEMSRGIDGTNWMCLDKDLVEKHIVQRTEEHAKKQEKQARDCGR
ncbi:NYN domain-containing protein [Ramlibacter alkalitolerans]|uniref:NYN domain-containing protein n=1 Tax=Ramlibacter alkalitolerans TaxID=2039631 RepID=A0ABS1JUD4_9BURK|nr:NYN domain-containing protein [Ramlibacter alkalitolerans]